jgi:hypothetical protein
MNRFKSSSTRIAPRAGCTGLRQAVNRVEWPGDSEVS